MITTTSQPPSFIEKEKFTHMIITEETPKGLQQFDLPSRMLKDRIIMVSGEVEQRMATEITQELLYLNGIDNTKPITMYVNTPGGSVTDGLMIVDTMNFISAPVYTVVVGMAASMGSVIASSGEKHHRYMLTHSRYMIHQPSGGAQGKQTDIEITAEQILKTRKELNEILAANSGQPIEKIQQDTEHDYWLSSEETEKYGFVDAILDSITNI